MGPAAVIERIAALPRLLDDERWLVRDDGQLRVAWHIQGMTAWLELRYHATRGLAGPIHPRLGVLHRLSLEGGQLVAIVEDDRGPSLVEAAEQLTDPVERENWVVGQIIGIAEGLAAARARAASFVCGYMDRAMFFIDATGHARLRAPIAWVPHPPATRSGPASEWMSAPYHSPELARNQPATAASDVFALATNLYEALTSRLPFTGDSLGQLAIKLLTEPHAPIAVFAPIFERAFAKDPAARIPDPETFAALLCDAVPDAREYDAVISDRIAAWRPA
jgi:serine/threonine protein kinase